jgi:hypothetical protein
VRVLKNQFLSKNSTGNLQIRNFVVIGLIIPTAHHFELMAESHTPVGGGVKAIG